jgi:hexokinase
MPTSTQESSWRQRSDLKTVAELSPQLEKEIERLDKELWISNEKLKKIVQRFKEELEEGT